MSKALQAPDDGYRPPDDGKLGDLPGLLRFHHDQLRKSAISDEVIRRRGYKSVGRPSAGDSSPRDLLKRLGFPGWARDEDARYPGILIPLYRPNGEHTSWQYRPDNPPKDTKTGKVRKYAAPVGRTSVVDVHPLSHDKIIDPSVALWITEGAKKADALTTRGQCAVSLVGVFGWRSQLGTLGGWEDIFLKSRQVNIMYDSDILTNMQVRRAAERLGKWLKSKGARPVYLYPPEVDGEQPKGVDDYFAAGGDLAHLWDTHSGSLPPGAVRAGPPQGIPYREHAGGIVWDRPTAQGTTAQPLTNFTAKITGHTIHDDGSGELRREFEVTACLRGQARTFGVAAERFAPMNWAAEHLGPAALVWPGMGVKDHARAAVQMLSGAVPERHVFAHTGWRQLLDGHGYLTASGAITARGLDESVTVDLGPLGGYKLPAPGDGDALAAAVKASLQFLAVAPDRVTVPLLGAVYRAPLPLPPDCAVWLYGRTGTLKTALCALAQQHFGETLDAYHLPGNWTSTANMLELQAFTLDGALFVVDDYSPDYSAFDARRRAGAADRLIRGAANHSGRGRLRPDATMRPPRPARAQILTSAEDLPPAGVSLRARTMVCKVAQGAVNLRSLTAVQAAADSGQLALAMSGYVRWLAAQFPGQQPDKVPALLDELKPRQAELRDWARAGGHPRVALNIASLALGWDKWLLYAEAAGAITVGEREQLWPWVLKALCDLGAEQACYQRDADPVAAYLRALVALIAGGKAHLASPVGGCPAESARWGWQWREHGVNGIYTPQGERVGWVDGADVYLNPDAAYKAAREFTEKSGALLGVSKSALHDDLAERGLLASTEGTGHHTVRRDLDGQRSRRVLHLSAYTFEHAAEV